MVKAVPARTTPEPIPSQSALSFIHWPVVLFSFLCAKNAKKSERAKFDAEKLIHEENLLDAHIA